MDTPSRSTTTDTSIEINHDNTISSNGNPRTSSATDGATEPRWQNGDDPNGGQLFAAAAEPSVESQPREDPEETVERLLRGYLDDVRELGVVERVAVGTEPGRRGAYLWNVLSEDISWGKTDFAPYYQLNRLGYELKRKLSDIVSVDVAHVSPSQLADFQERCQQQRIDLDFLPL